MFDALRKLFVPRRALIAPVPNVKTCCLDVDNLVLIEQRSAKQPNGNLVPIEVRRCSVCGCRHHRMIVGQQVKPGKVQIG